MIVGHLQLEMKVRDCRRDDIPMILEIENLSFDDPFPESLFISYLERFPNGFRVAVCNEKLSGYSILIPQEERSTAIITSLAVHPKFKRQKIATKLLLDAFSIARRIQMPKITLQVRVDNIAAQNLYSKLGFAKTGIIKDYYRKGLDAIEMRLLLELA